MLEYWCKTWSKLLQQNKECETQEELEATSLTSQPAGKKKTGEKT